MNAQEKMKNKILITTPSLDDEGGVVNYYRVLLKGFQSDSVELVQHTVGSRTEYRYAVWKRLSLYPFYFLADFLRLAWRLATDRKIRVVQVNPSLMAVPLIRDGAFLLLARIMRRKTIAFHRGWREHTIACLQSHTLLRSVFRRVYGSADCNIVLAESFSRALQSLGLNPARIRVSHTMFDESMIVPSDAKPNGVVRFIYLARISKLKGVAELLRAAARLKEHTSDFEFDILGEGDKSGSRKAMEEDVQRMGLGDHFHFHGHLSGTKKFESLARADVLVFPSWMEGCPTSVLEALGSGLFVVSSDVGALPEIIRENWNGRTFPARNADALARQLVWACENIEDIRGRRKEIQADAIGRFELQRICEQFRRIYRDLLDASPNDQTDGDVSARCAGTLH